jgi:rhodanese-related sulfurtransferase
MLNKTGAERTYEHVLETGMVPLDVDTFKAMAEHEGALVLDTRHQDFFAEGHVPNSISIGIDGNFAPWTGTLIPDIHQPIVLITEDGREEEVVMRLSRVGYDHTLGFLEGGFDAWKNAGKEYDTVKSISATEFAKRYKGGDLNVVDVRKPGEFSAEHVDGAKSLPLDFINERFRELDHETEYYIHCKAGYRSMSFASILKARGYNNLIDIKEGFEAILETDVPVTDYVCPSTLAASAEGEAATTK